MEDACAKVIPRQAAGLSLGFHVQPSTRRPPDVDNLCEPVLSVAIGTLGCFARRRPNMLVLHATRTLTRGQTGCSIALIDSPPAMKGRVTFDDVWDGPFPTSAGDDLFATWVNERVPARLPVGSLSVELHYFGAHVNLGEIATGPSKSVIDGLWPLFGGVPRAPHDHRVAELLVTKPAEARPEASGVRVVVRGE